MRTEQEMQRLQELAENFDPSTAEVDVTDDLRAIAEAADAVKASEALLRERVQIARAHNRSWGRIGIALGVSRQAARERFGEKVHA